MFFQVSFDLGEKFGCSWAVKVFDVFIVLNTLELKSYFTRVINQVEGHSSPHHSELFQNHIVFPKWI